MKLKYRVSKIEDVPEQFRDLYEKQSDGSYVMAVEGAADKARLDEFRTNNVELLKKLELFKDVDPAKLAEWMETERKLAEKKLIDAGDIDGLVNQRVSTMKRDYDKQIKELSDQLGLSTRQLETLLIDNTVRAHASTIGIAPTAVDDVLLRAKSIFKVKDGKPQALDSNGQVIYGKDGSTPLEVKDWISGLKEQAPHLFMGSSGSGSSTTITTQPGVKLTAAQKIAQGLSKGSSILS